MIREERIGSAADIGKRKSLTLYSPLKILRCTLGEKKTVCESTAEYFNCIAHSLAEYGDFDFMAHHRIAGHYLRESIRSKVNQVSPQVNRMVYSTLHIGLSAPFTEKEKHAFIDSMIAVYVGYWGPALQRVEIPLPGNETEYISVRFWTGVQSFYLLESEEFAEKVR